MLVVRFKTSYFINTRPSPYRKVNFFMKYAVLILKQPPTTVNKRLEECSITNTNWALRDSVPQDVRMSPEINWTDREHI